MLRLTVGIIFFRTIRRNNSCVCCGGRILFAFDIEFDNTDENRNENKKYKFRFNWVFNFECFQNCNIYDVVRSRI